MQHRYLLVVRFALINAVAAALLAAAWLQGWLDGILNERFWELSALIFLVFVYGLAICAHRVWIHSIELNGVKAGAPEPESWAGRYLAEVAGAAPQSRQMLADGFRLKITNRVAIVRHIANALVFLGLIGTVIGFIIALSGVEPESAGKAENVAAMVATLISGMSVALYTTLTGAILYTWLTISYRILVTGAVDLITATVELGEARGRSG